MLTIVAGADLAEKARGHGAGGARSGRAARHGPLPHAGFASEGRAVIIRSAGDAWGQRRAHACSQCEWAEAAATWLKPPYPLEARVGARNLQVHALPCLTAPQPRSVLCAMGWRQSDKGNGGSAGHWKCECGNVEGIHRSFCHKCPEYMRQVRFTFQCHAKALDRLRMNARGATDTEGETNHQLTKTDVGLLLKQCLKHVESQDQGDAKRIADQLLQNRRQPSQKKAGTRLQCRGPRLRPAQYGNR